MGTVWHRVPMHHTRARAPGAAAGECGREGTRGLPGAVREKPALRAQRAPGLAGVTLPWALAFWGTELAGERCTRCGGCSAAAFL